jgi:succinate-semialdehyde dehydrogenase/glutarate-semialdehyde dehydrogenase
MYRSVNPFDQAVLETFQAHSSDELERRLSSAALAVRSPLPIEERAAALLRAVELLELRKEELARLMAMEMGKPLAQGRTEIEKCGRVCRHFAENGAEMLREETVPLGYARAAVQVEPLGVLLAIMPWNFPFWQVFRFSAPALMAGNAVLLKHAPNVPQCALAVERLLHDAGWPVGFFQNLFADNDQVARLIGDRRVRGLSLTGSGRAGSQVAALAGHHLKKSVLELGGSDAFVVLGDADIALAAQVGAQSRLSNAGQACIAAKRFVVLDSVYEAFRDRLAQELRGYGWGSPLEPSTRLGPMARPDLLYNIERQVRESLSAGARAVLAGGRPDHSGNFYLPTLLENVPENAPAYREELFGPAAAIFRVPDEAAAIALANDTDFGLGASVWTSDLERGQFLAQRLEAGTVAINGLVQSDPRVPFGGTKDSGYGKELSAYGLKEFSNLKTVVSYEL